MTPFRVTMLATICALIMICAGAVQLLGVNRIVVTDAPIDATRTTLAATPLSGQVEIDFRSETFALAH